MSQTWVTNAPVDFSLTEARDHRAQLQPLADKAADLVARWINQNVPASVEGMPYARQWVLEETITVLKERV